MRSTAMPEMKGRAAGKVRIKKWCITVILLAILLAMAGYSYWKGSLRQKIIYPESLDKVAALVNGKELTLRELAFYVAYEEEEVERQAFIYNPQDTNEYWNLHANNTYIRVAARNAAIQMAIHDELFYQMARQEELALSEEEELSLAEHVNEFWTELKDYGKVERLGVEQEDIEETMRRIAYSQKMQYVYAQTQGMESVDYDFYADAYLEYLKTQDYFISEPVWGSVDFGNVTYTHRET